MGSDWGAWLRWGRTLAEGCGRAFGHESAQLLLSRLIPLSHHGDHLSSEAAANREALLEQAREFRGECWESLRRRGDEELQLRESLAQCRVDLGFYSNLHLVLFAALTLLIVGLLAGAVIGSKFAIRFEPDKVVDAKVEEHPPLQVRVSNGRGPSRVGARSFRLGGLL